MNLLALRHNLLAILTNYVGKSILCLLLLTVGCGYHTMNSNPHKVVWLNKNTTIRIDNFDNKTQKLGIEEAFLSALENRILTASPWKLVSKECSSNLILQATIDKCTINPLDFVVSDKNNPKLGLITGNSSRLQISIVASVRLLDGASGDVLVDKSELTFSRQYRVDVGIVGSYSQEINLLDNVLGSMANDFAESFLMQLIEGSN